MVLFRTGLGANAQWDWQYNKTHLTFYVYIYIFYIFMNLCFSFPPNEFLPPKPPIFPFHPFFLSVLSLCPWLSFLWGFDGCCDGKMTDGLSWFLHTNHDITTQSISFHITSHQNRLIEWWKRSKEISVNLIQDVMPIVSIIYSRNDVRTILYTYTFKSSKIR